MSKDAKDLLVATAYFSVVAFFACVAIYHWGAAFSLY